MKTSTPPCRLLRIFSTQRLKTRVLGICAAFGLALSAGSVHAADFTWISATQVNWNTAGNWSPSGPPTAGGSGTNNVVTPTAFGNVLFNIASGTVANWTYNSGSSWSVIGQNGVGGGALTISGTLEKAGTGTLTFRNSGTSANPLTLSVGSISLSAGALSFGDTGVNPLRSFTANSATLTGGTLNFHVGVNVTTGTATISGLLDMGGSSVVNIKNDSTAGHAGVLSVGSLSSASTASVIQVNTNITNADTGVLRLNNASGTTAYAGIIRNSGGAAANVLSVEKFGAGTQVFSGSSNTYSGGTTVTAGTLLVNNVAGSGLGVGAVTVTGTGATLGGSGRIALAGSNGITINAGGVLAPGDGTGTLTINFGSTTGGVTMLGDSKFKFELGTAGLSIAAPGTSDTISLTSASAGDFAFSAGGNEIDFLGTGGAGWYKLYDTDLISGTTWTNLTLSGQQITSGLSVVNLGSGLTGTLYVGDGAGFGDYNDIYLNATAVPEPQAWLLLGLGATVLLARVRHRKSDRGLK